MTIKDRFVYMIDSDRGARALDRDSGADIWHNDLLGVYESGAALAYKDFLVLGDSQGYLNWLSTDDGTILLHEKMRGNPITAAPVLWRNLVIALDREGRLSAYKLVSRLRAEKKDR